MLLIEGVLAYLLTILSVNAQFEVDKTGSGFAAPSRDLFNGHIHHMVSQTKNISGLLGFGFEYDQLHRIRFANTYQLMDPSRYAWNNNETATTHYRTFYDYDANGNLDLLARLNGEGDLMDYLTYRYNGNNTLTHVDDVVSAGAFDGDFDDQPANNYTYDGSGNLIGDVQAGTSITWNAYGKVEQVTHQSGANTQFGYDAQQNRIQKDDTHYIRDAQGNVMAVYDTPTTDSIYWREQHLYGSNRLGIINTQLAWKTATIPTVPAFTEPKLLFTGIRRYELTNHLGNVTAVVNERKRGTDLDHDGIIDYFDPTVVHAQAYYPFGLDMPGRALATGGYRYGFNGKERDSKDEMGTNSYHTFFRSYDPNIARWRSIDPARSSYPGQSPYSFGIGNPIFFNDPFGRLSYWGL